MSFIHVSPLTLILGGVLVAFACVFMFVHIRSRKKQTLKTLPGPTGFPIIGSSTTVFCYKNHWAAFSGLRKQYGDIYGVNLLRQRCVVVSNISLIKEVLSTKGNDFANRPDFLRFHAIFRGDRNLSIALCDWSDKQKVRREMAHPFMHPKTYLSDGKRMNEIIMFELQELVSSLSKVQNQSVEPRLLLNITTGNIFYQYICSKRFSEDDPTFRKTVQTYDAVFRELFAGYALDFMPWLKIFPNNASVLRELRKKAREVSSVTEAIFREHTSNPDSPDLIDIYQNYIQENEVAGRSSLTREEVEVIIEDLIGGHPVLGNLWLWGLYLLAANPEVCKNIREEVARVTCGMRAPTYEDRKQMPYTDAATYEILRVVSSPIIPHVATTDTSISGYEVKKDTIVMFNINDMNMDTQYWHEPLKFNPMRFVDSQGNVIKPDHFIPFGMGKRHCLGDGLVKATLFLGLSTLLQNFEISLPQGFPEPDILNIPGIVVPKEEIRLVFRRLDIAINMA